MKYDSIMQYMKANHLTDREVGERFGLSQSFINLLKNGKSRPNPGTAARISAETGVPILSILYPGEKRSA